MGTPSSHIRYAIIGLILSSIFILVFFKSAGTPIFSILGYFTLFFALAIAITRIRAEVGPPAHDVPWRPDKVLVSFLGTRRIGAEGLTTFSMFHGFNRSYRSHPMPIMLEGFKVAQTRGVVAQSFYRCHYLGDDRRNDFFGVGILCTRLSLRGGSLW